MSPYWQIHPYTIIGFLAFSLLIALGNALFLRRLGGAQISLSHPPFISVLVPARNEALNIERCVRSLLAQSYPSFEFSFSMTIRQMLPHLSWLTFKKLFLT